MKSEPVLTYCLAYAIGVGLILNINGSGTLIELLN